MSPKWERYLFKMHLLETNALIKVYSGRRVVDRVDINVKRGEVVGLLGPNGAGKTTTFYMITGIIPPDEGRITFDKKDITGMSMHMRARTGIGYLSQEPSIFRKLTVEENITAILETLDFSRKERKRRLDELLEGLKISHLRKRNPIQPTLCSGGPESGGLMPVFWSFWRWPT